MTYVYAALVCMKLAGDCKSLDSMSFTTKSECENALTKELKEWTDLDWWVKSKACLKRGRAA